MISKLRNTVKSMIQQAISKIGVPADFPLEETLEEPPDRRLGDVSSTVAMRLARQLKQKPMDVARRIAENMKISKEGSIEKVEVKPPGYINFFLRASSLAKEAIEDVIDQKERYGWNDTGKGMKVLVEHTSINPTKPLHIGHLRNAIIGDIISRIYAACGWKVEVQNLIDDMGRQVAVLVWGLKNKVHLEVPRDRDMKLDLWLGLVYSKADSKLQENPDLEKEIESIMHEMHDEKSEISRFARMISDKCVESNLETTSRLDVYYDLLVWESDIGEANVWDEAFKRLKNSTEHFGYETEGEHKGCFVVKLGHLDDFKDLKSSDKVIVRSSGVPTYIASDIAYQMWKFGLLDTDMKYRLHHVQPSGRLLWTTSPILAGEARVRLASLNRVINVIGYEQTYLQQVIRSSLRLLGYEKEADNSIHLSYKHVEIAEGRFSGRSGNWFGFHADAVVNRTVLQAYEQAGKNYSDLSELKKREVSETIGVGAVRYWLAKFKLDQTIVFDYDKVTDFDGETGPYIQYATVRATSILEKSREEEVTKPNEVDFDLLSSDVEFELIREIMNFPDTVIECVHSHSPHLLATYAHSLAVKFNKFYEQRPVLNAADKEKCARLSLVAAARQTLLNALSLLGIRVPERM